MWNVTVGCLNESSPTTSDTVISLFTFLRNSTIKILDGSLTVIKQCRQWDFISVNIYRKTTLFTFESQLK